MFNNELFLLKYGKYMKQLLSIKEKALKIVKSVRGSTAAGINISLLPQDATAGDLPVVLSGEETFFLAFVWNLPMVLYWKRLLSGVCWISGSVVWRMDLLALAFVAFGTFGTGEGLLLYGICIRC